jgi:polysaccharide export outer membrane protein
VTGNETVLDALTQVKDLKELDKKTIFIARPTAGGGTDQVLYVDWRAISKGNVVATNYQVLPGDRIFVAELSPPIFSYP